MNTKSGIDRNSKLDVAPNAFSTIMESALGPQKKKIRKAARPPSAIAIGTPVPRQKSMLPKNRPVISIALTPSRPDRAEREPAGRRVRTKRGSEVLRLLGS